MAYLPADLLDEFRAVAEGLGVSMSSLAGEVVRNFLNNRRSPHYVSPREIAEEILNILRADDLVGDKFAPEKSDDD